MYRYAQDYLSSPEKAMSGAFALGMHALFLLLLIFGVTWQKRAEPQANIVDLYPSVPAQARPVAPPPLPEVKPEPRAEPKPEPKPVVPTPRAEAKPVPKPAPKPEAAKPDIALKEKAEKERRQLEDKQKETRKRDEEANAVAARQQQVKEAEAQRVIKEQQDVQRKLAEQQAAAQSKLKNEYIERIRVRIKRFVVLPPNLQGNPEADFEVVLLPGGEVLGAKLKHSSGNAAYDSAVERAILKAQPLPLPPDPALFKDFRELNLKFRPQE